MDLRACQIGAIVCSTWLVLHSMTSPAWGFDPPVDQAGPLTLRIDGPEIVTEMGKPLKVQVTLENSGTRTVVGTLRVKVIDNWSVMPADGISFSVGAGARVAKEFQFTAGEGSFSAHYPIHAIANFSDDGKELTAHPILVVSTRFPAVQLPDAPEAWQPATLSSNRSLTLWQLPVFRGGLQPLGEKLRMLPAGWTGTDEASKASIRTGLSESLGDKARQAIGIHPPWAPGNVGTAWIEFPLKLPESTPILLQFATAVTPRGTGDGVTFRVRVAPFDDATEKLGEIVFDRHSAAKTWQTGEADLSRFSGQTIRLQLESDPGPARNTNYDQSYWAEPRLLIGHLPSTPAFPPTSTADSRVLGSVAVKNSSYTIRLWRGQRGLLDSTIGFISGEKKIYQQGFELQVLGERLDSGDALTALTAADWSHRDGFDEVVHHFEGAQGSFDVVGRLQVRDNALQVSFRLENAPAARPWRVTQIENLAINRFDQAAVRIYAGHGNVLQRPAPFSLRFDGHRLATSYVGFEFANGLTLVQTVDVPPTELKFDPERQHASLHAAHNATMTLIPADSVWAAAGHLHDVNGLRAAGGVGKLAGRFVFDLWGGHYAESQTALQQAFRYGLTDAAVVWHNWQRWGYDYRLPEIYPPNSKLGTEEELRGMIAACRQAGVLFALHDNYIDYYPDAEGFSYQHEIAFNANREPVRAWHNTSRDAQSYRYRGDRIAPWVQRNLQKIGPNLAPSAYFIDVWSSAPPYDCWTSDGEFHDSLSTRQAWGESFAWIRQTLGADAPQISESGHDQLIGWLDGAQTNHLRVGSPVPGSKDQTVWDIPCEDAERIPWFDAVHHDRFALHGAGYSSRYAAGLDPRTHGIDSDDYIATEVLTGHPGMVAQPFSREVVRKYWLTHDLMRALALRTIDNVDFDKDNLHRQQIRWSGGGEVRVNRGSTDWQPEGSQPTLPEYGWTARVPTAMGEVSAAIFRRNGVIVETAVSPDALYINAREPAASGHSIRPSVAEAELTGPRKVGIEMRWQIDEPIPEGYRPFIHFLDAAGDIAFQGNFDLAQFQQRQTGRSIKMPVTATLPETTKAGETFELRCGLYAPASGARMSIQGLSDEGSRIRLGTLEVTSKGVRWRPVDLRGDPHLARQNLDRKVIDFGFVKTAGGGRIVRDGNSVMLIPLPGSNAVRSQFELNWSKLPWKLPVPTEVTAIQDDGSASRPIPVRLPLSITCEPGVFAYRFTVP